MKRLKSMHIWISIFILVCLLAGCSWYPDGTTYNVEGESQVQVETNDSGDIKGKLTANVDIDAEVNIPDNNNWKNYMVKPKQFDNSTVEIAMGLFKGGNTERPTEIAGTGSNSGFYSQFSNGDYLTISKGRITFSTSMAIDRSYMYYIEDYNGIKENINDLFPYTDLEGISRETSIKKVQDICEKFNIEIGNNPEVYAIDYEHAQAIVNSDSSYNVDKNGNPKSDWTKDNNAYIIIFRMNVNGLPITNSNYSVSSGNGTGSIVKAIVNKDGIIYFNAGYIYDIEGESVVNDQLCTLSDVLKILEGRYQYITSKSQTNIAKISLEYVPVFTSESGKYIWKPYWVCKVDVLRTDIKDGNASSIKQRKTVFIDAVTKTVLE